MSETTPPDLYRFEISLSVLNHLGRNLYRNFITVLGEAISNSWDADANNVWIDIDRERSSFTIKDDGAGMDAGDFQTKFLKIGYSKRTSGGSRSPNERPYIGAKGIGKLALLSCAKRVSIFTKKDGTDYTGGVIDNAGLDKAIQGDQSTEEYPLEGLDFNLIADLRENHTKGTIICFQETNDQLRNSDTYLRKLLALSFKFSLLDDNFTIHVNGTPVTIDDLKALSDATQFLWLINEYEDEYVEGLPNLALEKADVTSPLAIKGFVGSVMKPAMLKITGTEERATIDLFVNGRLREKNIIRHIPTQRIVESYIYGQIHFDTLDRDGIDPFTSSREGVVEDDEKFRSLMDYLKRELLAKIIDDWDKFRLEVKEEGDDENARKSKRDRKAQALVAEATNDFKQDDDAPNKDQVDEWLDEIMPDAEFNTSAYVDCFLSENLVRKFIAHKSLPLKQGVRNKIDEYKAQEVTYKGVANISFPIRQTSFDLSYVDMNDLAFTAEGNRKMPSPSLWEDAASFRPVRNAVGHTGRLTKTAKAHLNLTLENIKGRLRTLLSGR
ncbi:MAG: ATP-binding protein [Pseudomonadota bacterium]